VVWSSTVPQSPSPSIPVQQVVGSERSKMSDIMMCTSITCENRMNCRRSPDSGTKPNPYRQSWCDFDPAGCQSYWMVDMDVIRERRRGD
jgi:hypothetical protein